MCLRLFRQCKAISLGTLYPLHSFNTFWKAYGPFASNVNTLSINKSIGIDLELVAHWMLSPNSFSRSFTVRVGSEETYRLCIRLYDAFLTMHHPLPHAVSLIVWNLYTQWPITMPHRYRLLDIETPQDHPVYSAHNSFEFHKHRLPGIGGFSATALYIKPLS